MLTVLRINVPVDHARTTPWPAAGAVPASQQIRRGWERLLAAELAVHLTQSVHVWTELRMLLGWELQGYARLDD